VNFCVSVILKMQQPQGTGIPISQDPSFGEGKTLWMGAIQPNWDETFIASLFQPSEQLVGVKLMRLPNSNMPAGYAFIEFSTHDAARYVLNTYNGQPIRGTSVFFRLNWGIGGRRHHTGFPHEFSLFVGDLSPDITDAVLQEAFSSRFSSCTSAKVVIDAATGGSKGFGFVRFTDKMQCDEALQMMNGAQLGSRAIRVSAATARRPERFQFAGGQPPQYHNMQQYPSMHDGGRSNGYRNAVMAAPGGPTPWLNPVVHPALASADPSLAMIPPQMQSSSTSSAQTTSEEGEDNNASLASSDVSLAPGAQAENTTVFVGNLDPSVSEEQLKSHFQSFGTIVQIKIPPNRGCGFVKFETREAAEHALATMHGSILCGLRIRLDWGKASVGRRQSGVNMQDVAVADYSTMQAHQYYMAQWQAQQAQAAYYYRYGAPNQSPVYVIPQQHLQNQMRPGMFQLSQQPVTPLQQQLSPADDLSNEFSALYLGPQQLMPSQQSLTAQQTNQGAIWNGEIQ